MSRWLLVFFNVRHVKVFHFWCAVQQIETFYELMDEMKLTFFRATERRQFSAIAGDVYVFLLDKLGEVNHFNPIVDRNQLLRSVGALVNGDNRDAAADEQKIGVGFFGHTFDVLLFRSEYIIFLARYSDFSLCLHSYCQSSPQPSTPKTSRRIVCH